MKVVKLLTKFFVISAVSFAVVGCQSESDKRHEHHHRRSEVIDNTQPVNPDAPAALQNVKAAKVVIKATKGNQVEGTVFFSVVEGGVKIVADVKNLKPGKHGFHVHEHGDCSAHDASSAGGHFNPTGTKHGGPDSADRHVGDLGNLEANKDGVAHYEYVDKLISLSGKDSIIGKSIVIHADEDDFKTQPTGNSGARIACGMIIAN